MIDVRFNDDLPKREYHGDLLLQVEAITEDDGALVGHDLRTRERFKVQLATADELAKHFVTQRDAKRTFDERLKLAQKRIEQRPSVIFDPDDATSLHIEVGSVVKLENVRTFTTQDKDVKTAAVWPSSLVRNPLQEAVIVGSVQANYFETKHTNPKTGIEMVNSRMDLTVVRDQDACQLKSFGLEEAFSGEWDQLPLTKTGVVMSIRNPNGETTVASLMTPYRKSGEPSVNAALDAPQGSYQIYAAAVVAAVTGARTFDDLKINPQVNPNKIETARKIYDHLVENPNSDALEITVMPLAKTQFLPAKALTNFLKDYHGTKTGKPSETTTPNPDVSYQGKGFVASQIAMSRHNVDPENTPASARLLSPQWKFPFAEIDKPLRIKDLGEESVVSIYGETYGANSPQAQADREQDQGNQRKKAFDSAPSR